MAKENLNKIGILGGSFDPPHIGHVHISKLALKKLKLNEVLWVVTKQNPLKKKVYLSEGLRLKLSKNILKALKNRSACLVGNHGQIAFSENLSKAFELAEEVENLSHQYINALKIGKPKILSLKEMNKVLGKAKNYKKG